ncbi:nucleolar protein 9 [Anopheles bellator]|uniref:nucleolar protein 9 n=1 Tax=Anopheles bellator TaxID=139047 RepID=UPI0026489AE8|nr:nucleolar protein 9 [Anopheles bellator]
MDADEVPPGGVKLGVQHYKNRAKKRKRNRFLENAKSFGRKGNFGRGAELDKQQYTYLVSILEAMAKQEDADERQLMANNVLAQLEGKEIRTASNQLGSRVLENLLTYTDEEMFARQMTVFGDNFRVVCCDSFASHVLQRMLYVALLRAVAPLQQEPQDGEPVEAKKQKVSNERREQMMWPSYEYNLKESYGDEHRRQCREFVERLAKFALNNLEEFVWSFTANYVVRQCILNLSGVAEMKVAKVGGSADDSGASKHLVVPEQWSKLVHDFNLRLISWPQFANLPYSELSSVVLQVLLQALARQGNEFQLQQLCDKLHREAFTNKNEGVAVKKEEPESDSESEPATADPEKIPSSLPNIFHQDVAIRLLEVCISVAPARFLKEQLFPELFSGHLPELALSRSCNFAVQKLLDHATDKETVEPMFSELEGSFGEILRCGHSGVLLALAKACARLSCQQGKFVKQLLDALHCTEVGPDKMLTAVLHLIPTDVTPKEAPKIHLHGSLILQTVLEFNKPIKFVTALLELANDRLAAILSDPRGSFIANAYLGSRFVGEKSREKMVRHLEGQYNQLVLTSHGSRVVELMFEAGNPAQRENIVRELAEQCAQLNGKPWGVGINKRLLVDTYKRDPARWKVAIKSDAKVERMFDKLVGAGKRRAN